MDDDKKSLIAQMEQAAQILEKYNLSDVEAEMNGMRFKVSRQIQMMSSPASHHGVIVNTASPSSHLQPMETDTLSRVKDNENLITSPMVGTVYVAPAPGAKPFVSIGTTVQKDQTLLIIEAMKTMNYVQAPRDGIVKEILVKNGDPVEYGDPLMIIE